LRASVFIIYKPIDVSFVSIVAQNNAWPGLLLGANITVNEPKETAEVPVAYLKLLFYDKSYTLVESKIQQITAIAYQNWQELVLDYTAQQDGYLQVLVANESTKDTWFDDMTIQHTPTFIV
jgi:hypothetical protein